MTPRVLVTGGTGFVGRPCVERVAAAGAEVHVLARGPGDAAGAEFHAVDLFDPDGTRDILADVRPTHLLHLAWVTTPRAYWTSPDNPRWAEASAGLLRRFAAGGGRRAVIAGSCAEYDWDHPGPCHEHRTPTRPRTLYGYAKNDHRRWAESFAPSAGVSLAWARLFFLFGPHEHPARLVPSVTQSLLADRPAECTTGTQVRDFLHVEDAADALVTLLLSDVTGPVNVASGRPAPVRAVVEAVGRATGRPGLLRYGAIPISPGDPPAPVADVGRLRDELGWEPRFDLASGVADAVAWWRACHVAV